MAKKSKESVQDATDRLYRFCDEYLIDLNGTKAAQRSGHSPDNEKAAAVTASRLLRNPKVMERLKLLMEKRSEATGIDSNTVLTNLLKLATSDLRKLFDEKGALLDVNLWPDDVAMAVASVEVDELFDGYGEDRTQIGYTKKVKFWDKPKTLELLGKHLKLFTEKHEHSLDSKLEDLLAGSNKKENEK